MTRRVKTSTLFVPVSDRNRSIGENVVVTCDR